MIPTRSKAKLPGHLSYPVGAETISEALDGAPHSKSLSLVFYDQAVWPASEFRRLVTEGLPYVILTAEYQPQRKLDIGASNDLAKDGWYDEKWELRIYPVLNELKPLANRLMREEGLPTVVTWLKSDEGKGWTRTWQRLELVFNPADKCLAYKDTRGV